MNEVVSMAGTPDAPVRAMMPFSLGPAVVDRLMRERPRVCAIFFVLMSVALLMPYRHFAGDDAYITFRFARNLAAGAGFSYNPGVPTYGSTAPLWVFFIAGLHRVGLDIPTAAHAMNWIFSVANVLLFLRLAVVYLGKNSTAALAALLFIADPWFIRWSLSGMENALALFLLISLLLSQAKKRNSGRINWLSPIFAALAGLCRPEMNLLCGLLLLDIVLLERRRRAANLLVACGIFCLVLLPWLAYAASVFHSLIPNTVTAKVSSDHYLALTLTLRYFATFWVFQAAAVVAVIGITSLRYAFKSRYLDDVGKWFMPVAWAAILPLFYIAGGAPVAGRYMVFGLPSYLLIGVAALATLSYRFPRLVGAAVLATLLLMVFVQYRYCWYVTRWGQGMDPRMIEVAQTLERTSRPTDVVAADQIGVLGYFSRRAMLDTFGLASPEVIPYRHQLDPAAVWHFVHERRVQYLFVVNPIAELAHMDPAYNSLTLVDKADVQREGANAQGALITYYLYRTNWDGEEAAHTP